VVEQTCTARSYGARAPLRRALQKFVEDPLSEALIEGLLTGSSLIEIYKAENDTLAIRPLAEEGLADLENLAHADLWRPTAHATN
jgi:ATP-dependent Clp protease ATP-binding subunit ClpC